MDGIAIMDPGQDAIARQMIRELVASITAHDIEMIDVPASFHLYRKDQG